MRSLVKPAKLQPGDKVATVSLSAGTAGDAATNWRYWQGKERIEQLLGFEVVEMPHTLAGSEYLAANPQARADDMMAAFNDPTIKGIFSCIGGSDAIKMLPYIDLAVIHSNPKVFMGYSDTTTNHLMCYKAGLSSIYGPALLSDFAENVAMPEYTLHWVKRTLFDTEPIGEIPVAPAWCSQRLDWVIENKDTARGFQPNTGYEVIQGSGSVQGRLIGGCLEVFLSDLETDLFPSEADFQDALLFFETSEMQPPPTESYEFTITSPAGWFGLAQGTKATIWGILPMLQTLAAKGILQKAAGLVFAKPVDEKYYHEYQVAIRKALAECGRAEMPVLYNLSFGHCEPKFCLPYGALAEINCTNRIFSILESAVI